MSAVSSASPARSPIGAFTPDLFASHVASLGSAPSWWLERKKAAFQQFSSLPLPKRTDESWRFSNFAGIALDNYALLSGAKTSIAPFPVDNAASLTFVNNTAIRGAVSESKLPAGVIVTTIADALVRHPDLLRQHFMAQPQKLGSDKFAALHVAFLRDGAFIYVPKNVEVPLPILVQHIASGPGSAVFPHTLVIAEENAKVTVIDTFTSEEAAAHLAIGANDLYAAHGAQLTYVGAQAWSRDTLSFQFNSTVVRRDARVQSLNLHLGARQARHESLSQLQAPGAFSEMLALTVADKTQEFDQRTLQIHQAPSTKSDLLYKNALRDTAKTIFSGLIVVDPDAQKTDAYQSNRNLLLSEDAEANSLPGLEIQANDVRCTHGATSSRIDPEQEFYLQSRGIDKETADELLTFGFFEEVLNRLASDPIHDALRALIQTQFKR